MRSFFARMFYRLINRISKTEIVDGARDFRMMTRQMVESILSLHEVSRFSKGIFSWVGYRTKWLEYENVARVAGETKWSFWKLLLYSIDGIIGFSTFPLAIASVVGVLFCVVAFILILFFFFKTLIWGDPVAGFPATICIILLLGGIQLFCVGILGQYLSKTYLETKNGLFISHGRSWARTNQRNAVDTRCFQRRAFFCMRPTFFVYPIDKRQKRAILQKKVKDSQ